MGLLGGMFSDDDDTPFQPYNNHSYNSSVCKDCGLVMGDIKIHKRWHGLIDAMMVKVYK